MLSKSSKGLFTASEFHKLMTREPKTYGLPAGAITYVYKKVTEIMALQTEEQYISAAIARGNEKEIDAIIAYENKYNCDICFAGDSQQTIICYEGEFLGEISGTPDGIIESQKKGIEVKCPNSDTHLFNLVNITDGESLKVNYPQYYWQIQGYMFLTGYDKWVFMSYDDRFYNPDNVSHCIEIKRNEEDIEKLKARLRLAIEKKNEILTKLKVI